VGVNFFRHSKHRYDAFFVDDETADCGAVIAVLLDGCETALDGVLVSASASAVVCVDADVDVEVVGVAAVSVSVSATLCSICCFCSACVTVANSLNELTLGIESLLVVDDVEDAVDASALEVDAVMSVTAGDADADDVGCCLPALTFL